LTVCEDDPNYADACPEKAEIKNYCQDQEKFMRKNCPKSCGFCFNECKDDPEYEESCKDIAATTGLCEEQKKFTQEHCALSCKWCELPTKKAPIQGTFCRDRDVNCGRWKSLGLCDRNPQMTIYCGLTCDICKEPTPDKCFDKAENCEDMKKAGFCNSTVPTVEHEVKTNCLETCEFCVPELPWRPVQRLSKTIVRVTILSWRWNTT